MPALLDYGTDWRAACRCAKRLGYGASGAAETAFDFLAWKLEHGKEFGQSSALLNKCAHDFVANWHRARQTIAKHEMLSCEVINLENIREMACLHPTPEQVLMRQAFLSFLHVYLNKLQSEQREIFMRRHLSGHSIADLAAAYGKTSHAIEQSLHRTALRLRILLERDGIDAGELHGYLPPPAYHPRQTISQEDE